MNDKELLTLINSDSRKGFESLIDEYSPLVYKIVSSIVLSCATKEDAEECASDVFVNFYTHRSSFNPQKGTLKGYLAASAKHMAFDFYRKRKNEAFLTDSIEEMPEIQADDFYEEKENNAEIVKAVKALGEPDSTIIIRKYIFGETAKEIAKRVKMTPAACEKRLQRALKKLKNNLGGVFDE